MVADGQCSKLPEVFTACQTPGSSGTVRRHLLVGAGCSAAGEEIDCEVAAAIGHLVRLPGQNATEDADVGVAVREDPDCAGAA